MLLLSIRDLRTSFRTPHGVVRAVDGVSIDVNEGEVLGIVGESGCGKSVLALSVLRLLPMPPAVFDTGEVLFQGRDLLSLTREEMRHIRGNSISMIFQEPMTALNPVFTVGNQIEEVFRSHQGLPTAEARERAIGMLRTVGVPAPERRVREYPHQLSGGMRQRVMIAMALACRPALLIADEPTTALDVTIQAQILDLMAHLRKDFGTAVIMISHDLGVIAETAHRVVVMYTGRVAESATTLDIFDRPLHPYTQGLLRAIPSPEAESRDDLYEISGAVPSLTALPPGCTFNPRCPLRGDICTREVPVLREIVPGHCVACWMVDHA